MVVRVGAEKNIAHWVFWTGCAFLLGCVFLQWPLQAVLHRADLRLYDTFTAMQPPEGALAHTVIVDIDEITLDAVGQWPWPRYKLAALVEQLQEGQPACVVLDIVLPERDRTSPQVIRERYREDFDLNLDFTGLPPGLEDNDAYLAAVLAEKPTLGALFMLHDLYNTSALPRLFPLTIDHATRLSQLPVASGLLSNTPHLQNALAGAGFINTLKDPDGVLRRFFMLYEFDKQIYPHITLAVLMEALGANKVSVHSTFNGAELRLLNAENHRVASIPVTSDGSALLRFNRTLQGQSTVSALDVLRGQVDPSVFAGKIVLVGASAAGLNDLHHTPLAVATPGTAIQGVFLNNVLATSVQSAEGAVSSTVAAKNPGGPYSWPWWGASYAALFSALVGLSILGVFTRMRPLVASLSCVALLCFSPLFSAGVFTRYGVFLPMAAPLGTGLVLLLYCLGGSYVAEHKRALANLRAVTRTRQLTLEAMASIAEMRTVENDGHIRRTQQYVRLLAEHLQKAHVFPELSTDYIDLLFHSAPLHDLGKVAIADAVLFKPGALSSDEFEAMKQHTRFGFQAIESAASGLDLDHFLILAAEVALTHHEHWDGTGYPQGLAGDGIPLSGRIMALADVYDALVSKRVYKEGFSHEKAREIIVAGRGTHFDPRVVDAFLAQESHFQHYAAHV